MQHHEMSLIRWLENLSRELLRYNDITAILDRILFEARNTSHADAGTVFLVENGELVFAYTHNDTLFPVDMAHKYSYANARLPINTTSIAGYCATIGKPLNLANVRQLPPHMPFVFNDSFDRTTGYVSTSVFSLPLHGKNDKLLGVIQLINSMKDGKAVPFTDEMCVRLTLLGTQAVNAIDRSMMIREMIYRMQNMAALSDPKETGPHVERVGALAAELYSVIARRRHVDIDVQRIMRSQIRLAAMLHDLGKVAIPHEVLKKPGKLTDEEFAIMQTHCAAGARLFSNVGDALDNMTKLIALHHHQKWNGRGYTGDPETPIAAGEMIPFEARIVAVGDVFDALVSQRCYKPAWAWGDAVEEIRKEAGTHFDPEVVDAFLEIEDIIQAIYARYQG